MAYEKKENELGTLWKKISQSGKEYLSGYIEINGIKIDVVGWLTSQYDLKQNPNRPALKLVKSIKLDQKPLSPPADDFPDDIPEE